eukprot:5551790-Prymnesium_polylepis.1
MSLRSATPRAAPSPSRTASPTPRMSCASCRWGARHTPATEGRACVGVAAACRGARVRARERT